MKATVIIPTIGTGKLLQTMCLPGLYFNSPEMPPTVIIDNAAKPKVQLDGWALDSVSLIRSSAPLSFAAACNLGAKEAETETLIFLNDDCRVFPGWLEAILAPFENPTVGIVGAKLFDSTGKIQHVGVVFGRHRVPYHDRIGEADSPKLAGTKEAVAVTGALMAVRKSWFDSVGGFCEEFPDGNYEDVDLCMQARDRELSVKVAMDCQALHIGGATSRGLDQVKFALEMRRNWQILHERWKDKPDKFFGITKKTLATERERTWGLCETTA